MNFNNTPYSKNRAKKFGKLSRDVCIIGVGMTPVSDTVNPKSPCYMYSDLELAAYAAQLAMADANVNANDVDAMYFSQCGTGFNELKVCHQVEAAEWCGMSGKPAYKHEEACASSYLAIDDAIMAIASGKYDIVMVVGADTGRAYPVPFQPPHMRRNPKNWGEDINTAHLGHFTKLMQTTNEDSAYVRWNQSQAADGFEEAFKLYMDKYGVTGEEIDEAIKGYAVNSRRGAALNELSKLYGMTYEKEAAAVGLTVDEYFASPKYNPRVSEHCSKAGMGIHGDGGGALILCSEDIAKKYNKEPIKISAFGISQYVQTQPYSITRYKEDSLHQLVESTGIKSEEIDALYAGDFTVFETILAAEMIGYLPEGEGWKYARDGELAFDGSKPMNTHGGAAHFGHVWGAQAFEFIREAVMQMRGKCGDHQIKKPLNKVVVSGWGGNRCNAACVLEKMD